MSPLIAAASAVADPPVPNRSTRIAPPSAAVKAKDNLNMGIMAVVAGLIAAVCFGTGHSLPGYILGILAAIFLVSIFTKKTDVGQCPYCLAEFRETVSVKDHLLRCDQCGEYSQVTNKVVKPLDPVTYSNTPKFESAVFKQGSMPNACAACGAPATRLDTVATSSMNKSLAAVGAARLMTGAPGLAIFSSTQASISIPYCDQHREAVGLSFDWRKRPVLSWSSLRMLRRYLAVNRGKEKY
jgi:hypothetical protein